MNYNNNILEQIWVEKPELKEAFDKINAMYIMISKKEVALRKKVKAKIIKKAIFYPKSKSLKDFKRC